LLAQGYAIEHVVRVTGYPAAMLRVGPVVPARLG
jgi:hypothetical protein